MPTTTSDLPIGCGVLFIFPILWYLVYVTVDGLTTGQIETRFGTYSRKGASFGFWFSISFLTIMSVVITLAGEYVIATQSFSNNENVIMYILTLIPVYWFAFRRRSKKWKIGDQIFSAMTLIYTLPVALVNLFNLLHNQPGAYINGMPFFASIPAIFFHIVKIVSGNPIHRVFRYHSLRKNT